MHTSSKANQVIERDEDKPALLSVASASSLGMNEIRGGGFIPRRGSNGIFTEKNFKASNQGSATANISSIKPLCK